MRKYVPSCAPLCRSAKLSPRSWIFLQVEAQTSADDGGGGGVSRDVGRWMKFLGKKINKSTNYKKTLMDDGNGSLDSYSYSFHK